MHLIAFSFEAASDGNLSHLQVCTTPMCEYIPIVDDEMSHTETPYHILSLCVVISKKFPRLLAEREIIANASMLVRISPRTDCKTTNFICISASQEENSEKKMEDKRKMSIFEVETLKIGCISEPTVAVREAR